MQLFYKTITKWISVQDSVIHALGMLLDFGKRINTLACGSCYFTLSENFATFRVYGSRYPARITIPYWTLTLMGKAKRLFAITSKRVYWYWPDTYEN